MGCSSCKRARTSSTPKTRTTKVKTFKVKKK